MEDNEDGNDPSVVSSLAKARFGGRVGVILEVIDGHICRESR